MIIDLCLLILAVAFAAGLVRVVMGPTVADRAAAADVEMYIVVAALVLLSIRAGSDAGIDIVLIATLLSFVATIALARLVRRPGDDTPEGPA